MPFVSGTDLDSENLSAYLWSHKERMVPHIFQLRAGYGRGNDEEEPDLQLVEWVFDTPAALTATNCSYQYRALTYEEQLLLQVSGETQAPGMLGPET